MPLAQLRFLSCLLTALFAVPFPAVPFDTPLSDTAVRQAYFLGQRHDETFAHFFDKYVKHLPPPESGPYVSSVAFLTPYALLAKFSSEQPFGYNAQKAELDHRQMTETVKIRIEIQLTPTYPAKMPNPHGRTSGSPWDSVLRSSDFWRDFRIQVLSNGKVLSPLIAKGEPSYICGQSDLEGLGIGEYCTLEGAIVHLEFLADEFSTDEASISIDPPEGQPVAVVFNLYELR